MSHQSVITEIEGRAERDGQFAIAYAILQLVGMQESVAEALHKAADAQESVAEALYKIADVQERVADALHDIGKDDGSLEFVGYAIRDALDRIAEAIK